MESLLYQEYEYCKLLMLLFISEKPFLLGQHWTSIILMLDCSSFLDWKWRSELCGSEVQPSSSYLSSPTLNHIPKRVVPVQPQGQHQAPWGWRLSACPLPSSAQSTWELNKCYQMRLMMTVSQPFILRSRSWKALSQWSDVPSTVMIAIHILIMTVTIVIAIHIFIMIINIDYVF